MKIDSITPKKIYGTFSKVQEKPEVTAKKTSASDRVELSKEAVTFSAAMKAAKQSMGTNDVDKAKRIETITKQIKDGSYNVSGEDIAEKMLDR